MNGDDLRLNDFDYELPDELIAQQPAARRDESRLMVIDRASGSISHRMFTDLPSYLRSGDRLVINDTRVVPARLFCVKKTGARIELLFVERQDDGTWSAMIRPRRRIGPGAVLSVEQDPAVTLVITGRQVDGNDVIEPGEDGGAGSIDDVLEKYGTMPLPPYIRRSADAADRERYQTVYARQPGAIAAPTAGLHFSDGLFNRLAADGVGVSRVTLHVGIGTFRPVKTERIADHVMHAERYLLSAETAAGIRATRQAGGRIVAVGTTSVRVLEQCSAATGRLEPCAGKTRLFILPGYRFRCVDALLTNFHLPKSTLLMLVSAFAGRELVMNAYREAVREKYRFFSYGDAMLII